MIPQTQREALAVLAELCDSSPDVRLGQLFAHLGFLGEDQTGRSLWDIDDEQLLTVLYHHRAELAARSPGVTPNSTGNKVLSPASTTSGGE
ncbi:MAG TPA: hypothetical protein VFC46_14315 [Humisphaera sp.]|nr:hypothetical protein [Humisphaera sp.]